MGVSCYRNRDRRRQVQSLIGKIEGDRHFRRGVSVDGRMILKCVLNMTGGFGLFFFTV